ncbi:TonB-dependent receptor [Taibaiella lutea]|nr:TonB-dependent receptor [Taibaiella lutea]
MKGFIQNVNMKHIYAQIKTIYQFILTLTLFISGLTPCYSQTGCINGYVMLQDGKPVCNLRITLPENSSSTLTDAKGRFEILNLKSGDYTINISTDEQLIKTETISVTTNNIAETNIVIPGIDSQYLSEIMINGSHTKYVTEKPSGSLRIGSPLIEVPQNITVINARTIRDIGVNTTDDILRTAAGVLPGNNAGQDIYTMIRGSTTQNSILRNGVGSGYYYNMNPDAAMIDRVEFIKGPAGFMISNANPGGIINIITKQPVHEKTLRVEAGYGSWNMLRTSIDLGGEIKKRRAFTYRFNAGVQRQRRHYRYGYFNKYFIAGAFQYDIKQSTNLVFEYNFMEGKSLDDVRYLPSVNGKLFVVPNDILISDPNASGVSSHDHYFKLNLYHKFSKHWSLNTHAGVVFGKWHANGMKLDEIHHNNIVSDDTIYRYTYKDKYDNKLYNAIVFLQGEYNTGRHLQHNILIGLDFGKRFARDSFFVKTDNKHNLYYPDPAYHIPTQALNHFEATIYENIASSHYEALYLQDHLKIYNKVILTLAMRYTICRTPSSSDKSLTQTDKKITPRLGLTYLINSNLSLYALTDEAFVPQIGRNFAGRQFEPLTGNNKEIGLKSFWFERKFCINLTVYRTVRNNALAIDPDYPDFQKATGQSVTKGIELDIIGQISKSISILANYAYTDSRVTKSNNLAEIGLYTFNSPVHNIANLFIKYKFTDKALKGLSFSAGLQYKDKFSSSYSENSYLPGYTLLEAGLSYAYRQWYLNFNVYNLTNRKYINFGSKYNDTDWVYAPGPPLNFRLAIGFRLG